MFSQYRTRPKNPTPAVKPLRKGLAGMTRKRGIRATQARLARSTRGKASASSQP